MIWVIGLVVVVAAFFGSFAIPTLCGAQNWVTSLALFFVCAVLIYVSFLAEGIIIAITKIEDYDDNAMIKAFRAAYGEADSLAPDLVRLKHKAGNIVTSQPLVTIVIAFIVNAILGTAGDVAGSSCPLLPGRLHFLLYLYSNKFISTALTTMLIYWVSQALPQSIGMRSAVAFMRFHGAMLLADSFALVANTGVGYPGEVLEKLVVRAGLKMQSPKVPMGDRQLHEAIAEDFGRRVASRLIRIGPGPEGLAISDAAKHVYLVPRRDIEHVYGVAISQLAPDKPVALDLGFATRGARERIDSDKWFYYATDVDVFDSMRAGTEPTLLYGERVHTVRSSCELPVFWTKLQVKYACRATIVDTEPGKTTSLYFPLGLPTKVIEVIISPPDGCFVRSVTTSFTSGPSLFYNQRYHLQRGTPLPRRKNGVYKLVYRYPPLAAEIKLDIEFRRKDELIGSATPA